MKRLLVAGAGAPLGREIARLAVARGLNVLASYRTPRPGVEEAILSTGAKPVRFDLSERAKLKACLTGVDAAVFTPILTAAAPAAELLGPHQQAVFFSSNNVSIDPQTDVYAGLLAAEQKVKQEAPIGVILRPTMIYGYANDGNITTLMAAMRRWPVIPLPGGKATQQPVYYKDLAEIALNAALDPKFAGATCTVGGPTEFSKRTLYTYVAKACRVRKPVAPVPLTIAEKVVSLLESTGLRMPVTSTQLKRAALDKRPVGEAVILGRTPFEGGVNALLRDLDDTAAGA